MVIEVGRVATLFLVATGRARFPMLLFGIFGLVDGGEGSACRAARLVRTIAAICDWRVFEVETNCGGYKIGRSCVVPNSMDQRSAFATRRVIVGGETRF